MILIVDDDPDFVKSVGIVLEKAGHRVASANNRADGMSLCQAPDLDLLILDVMMVDPDDGIAMAQDLRKAGFNKPILMMSSISKVTGFAYDKDESVMPVDDFVEKPVKPDVLLAKVGALLKKGKK
jgi:two-component system, OmpR family, response regulator